MKRKFVKLLRRDAPVLQEHLKQGPQVSVQPGRGPGRQALSLGLETLDMARMRELALPTLEATCQKVIAGTQRFVEESDQSINRFARELDLRQPV